MSNESKAKVTSFMSRMKAERKRDKERFESAPHNVDEILSAKIEYLDEKEKLATLRTGIESKLAFYFQKYLGYDWDVMVLVSENDTIRVRVNHTNDAGQIEITDFTKEYHYCSPTASGKILLLSDDEENEEIFAEEFIKRLAFGEKNIVSFNEFMQLNMNVAEEKLKRRR